MTTLPNALPAQDVASPEPVGAKRPVSSRLEQIILYGVFGELMFGPLAFGAVEPWSLLIVQLGAVVLFVLWAVMQAQSGELRISANPVFAPMLSLAGLMAVQLAFRRTAYAHDTVSSAEIYCAYGVLCFLAAQCLRRTAHVRKLAVAFSAFGALIAVFAIVQSVSGTDRLYWLRKPAAGGWIYGPYVNHNHYAGLMELLVPVPLVLALGRFCSPRRRAIAAAAAAVMASTIFLCGSRGGMIAFAVEMAMLAAVAGSRQKSRKTAMAIGVFLVTTFGLLAWLGGGELASRIESIHRETRTELSGGTRMDLTRDGLKMFRTRPILGFGLGTFPDVYPRYRSFYTTFFVNAAHNDYVQLLVEMGALGFATMLWLLLSVYRGALKKLHNWSEDTNGALALAAMLGCTGILVHSALDFNLQIPANAALFYVLCTLAAMEPRFGTNRRVLRKHSRAVAEA